MTNLSQYIVDIPDFPRKGILFRDIIAYALEYGSGVLEMQTGQGRLLIVDDVLATGGTLQGATELCERAGFQVGGLAALIDLKLVPEFHWKSTALRTVINYG